MKTEARGRALRVALLAVVWATSAGLTLAGPDSAAQTVRYRNTTAGVGHVGSKACAACHAEIYREYMRSAMGRSMAVPSGASDFPRTPATIHFEKFHREYQAFRQEGGLFQSEYETGPDGTANFRDTHRISYVIGAGVNGASYIVRSGDYLFEAPLSFYTRTGAWGLSPGYELADFGFLRPVAAQCIVCHSGRPQPVDNRDGLYRNPPFTGLAIGCEDCHGPGQLHVEERSRGAPLNGAVDDSIVNPARLDAWLRDNICMKCHQAGDVRVLEPGKSYGDFRPGTPLDSTIAVFAVPFTRASPPQSPLLQHYQLMILSKCYRSSGGRMSCTTCHDPHVEISAADAPVYYRKKCLACHASRGCTLPLARRRQMSPPDNCIGCHMPRQNLRRISHAALTNHRIVAYSGEPFPHAAFHETTAALPDLVHLDAIPSANAEPAPIVLFRAYAELSEEHPQYQARYEELLEALARSRPRDPEVLSALARRDLKQGTPAAEAAAKEELSAAIRAGSTLASDYELEAQLLDRSGDAAGAASVLKRGIALNPYSTRLLKRLTLEYIQLHDYHDALATMKEELAIYPEDSFMRRLVGEVERAR